jgi:hypothetical protein
MDITKGGQISRQISRVGVATCEQNMLGYRKVLGAFVFIFAVSRTSGFTIGSSYVGLRQAQAQQGLGHVTMNVRPSDSQQERRNALRVCSSLRYSK